MLDSGIGTDKYVSFVATDNYKGGVIAARRMGKILNGKGKIVVVKYAPGSASTMKRENGFINTIKKEFPEIEIVDAQYGKDTVETALQVTEDMLTKNAELNGKEVPRRINTGVALVTKENLETPEIQALVKGMYQ